MSADDSASFGPRPGTVVFDEPSPIPADQDRDRAVRTDPAFVAFRERVAAVIDAGGAVEEPTPPESAVIDA